MWVSLTLHTEFGLGLVVQSFTGVYATVSISHTLEDQDLLGSVYLNLQVSCRLQHYAVLHPSDFI